MTAWTAAGYVLGAACLGFLVFAIALATALARRRDARRLRAQPLLRFTYTAEQWATFLRGERRKHVHGAIAVAVIVAGVGGGTWATCRGGADRTAGSHLSVAGFAAICLLIVLALSALGLAKGHYLAWALRGRAEVAIFPFGVVIAGKLIDWTTQDTRLRDARTSPAGDVLELELERASAGGSADVWASDVLRLPLPAGVRADAILPRLIRG